MSLGQMEPFVMFMLHQNYIVSVFHLRSDYERRMKTLLEKLKARLAWLKKGSRDVFGSILENNIYILIDTSQSMQHHLSFVKEKLRLLIQDQLHTKERVNLVAFNSAITPWRDRLTKINDTTTYSQLQPWIDGLNAEGSTNTLAALRFALADPTTEAIYLLTDGRPDQNERHILSQVQYRQTVPIHTIAFNCNDQAANRFLIDLAKQTGGRFHTFSCGFEKQAAIEIPESEDVGGVKNELIRGEKELERIAGLRDECLGIAWSQENLRGKFPKSKSQRIHNDDKPIPSQRRSQSTLDLPFRPNTASMPLRTTKKKRSITNKNRQRRSKSATNLTAHSAVINYNNDQWLLPETKEYLKVSNETEETKSDTENQDKVEIERPKRKPIRTPYNEVISYLKRKSLVVQGLTIFDVLYPTSVTVKDPHHIQVIDRYVLAKVWDDILPLTYGSYVGKLRLVNHYAVDLEKYEVKLKELIDNYHKFTTDFIWKHLSDDDKRKLGPSIHWDSLSKDEQNKITQEIRTEEYTSQNSLENFAWRKLTEQEQNALLQKPVPYQDKNQTLVKAALKEAEAESALKGIARMDVEIHRAIKFLQISTDLRQLQKRADADAKPAVEQKPKIKPKSAQHNFHQRVICRFDADGFFHPGTIQKNPDGRAMIRFDIGIEQEAVGHIMLPTNGAIAQPHLYVNDCVLVRRINGTQEYWAPGVVAVLPSPTAQPPPLYMVQVYAPSLSAVHVHRRDILKISLGLYQRTVSYLQSINRKPEPPTDSIPKIPDESSFKDVLRRELEPLTTKVEHIHKSNKIRYRQLKAVLEDQMNVINDLQEKTSNKVARLKRAAPVSISLIPDHDEPDPPKSISSRRSSVDSSIQPNTQVFALWLEDDSFVYEGIILNKLSHSNSYTVKRTGLHGVESIISRENIFLQTDLICLKTLHSPSFALIEYPKNGRNCWKPAAILPSDDKETQKSVRFYDGMDVAISNSKHVIPIDRNKFQEYAQYRIDFEKSLIGQVIVGLNQEEKKFMLGTVIDRVAHGHTYTIQWCDKNQSEQDEEYLYGAFTRSIRHQINDTVLAMDDNQCLYKLARVIHILRDKKKLIVRFIDAEEDNREIEVPAATTFVITTPAFESIIEKQKTT
ncbi:unnamed protein product [Rotaria magnacalcarata]|uniref:VWFA domain-containing protein n=1 Tax=Rotaria magnacalcarata TaxID=392030 RepID=A0A8S2JZC4_9BILA|nr:unnamed protein product [Rotaria magnacalcarata]